MRSLLLTSALIVTVTASTAFAATNAVKLKQQETCPVMGEKINKKYYVDYKGKRIYACCGMCPDKIKKDPEKYIGKLKAKGESVETIAPAKPKANGKTSTKPDSIIKMDKDMKYMHHNHK